MSKAQTYDEGLKIVEDIIKAKSGMDPVQALLLKTVCHIVYALGWNDGAFIARGCQEAESNISVRDMEALIQGESK